MVDAFFYGTLIHPKILQRVIGNGGSHLRICPAIVKDFTRHQVKDADYPALVPYSRSRSMFDRDLEPDERSVKGSLVSGLLDEDVRLLDIFEGNEYVREVVPAHPLAPLASLGDVPMDSLVITTPISEALVSKVIEVNTYVWVKSLSELSPDPWAFDDFVKHNAWKWIGSGSDGNRDYAEVDRRREMEGIIAQVDFPDFSHYKLLRTLSAEEFPIHGKDDRIIAVGDIHGMNKSLSDLLTKIAYRPESDTLIHLGDIVTKGSIEGSLAILSFMSTKNIMGVRGNNDQDVIQWWAWRDWIQSFAGGREWLDNIDREYPLRDNDEELPLDPEFWSWSQNRDWEKRIPQGWKLFGRHYNVARAMSREHYDYLRSLPIVMHAPNGHTFFVHAGMLAADPNRKPTHPSQPLSHWPSTRTTKKTVIRSLQETALLQDVPQNKDPWVLLNMRGVEEDGTVTKESGGTPWPELWNDVMDRCGGIDADDLFPDPDAQFAVSAEEGVEVKPLPCFPAMIVYGHIAARGLDPRRWSIGLDTGCVYNRRLTALVLDKGSFFAPLSQDEDPITTTDDIERSSSLLYGDNGRARLVSVEC
ncbi:hypothetical protein ID866_3424 [Astraeus odoratus]|nr:hypothetical protein ID866_3424 [Astraeus odoratus]